MLSDYTFLTDHSYSLRLPIADDHDDITSKQREDKTKKRRQSSNRSSK
jgi:hypothetical protein